MLLGFALQLFHDSSNSVFPFAFVLLFSSYALPYIVSPPPPTLDGGEMIRVIKEERGSGMYRSCVLESGLVLR